LTRPTRPPASPLKPRKKPGQRRSAATVEAIVEAAARIQETRGLEGYTTNAVAERAGASIGTLYQYFPNKDAITRALIERELAALLADIAGVEAETDGRAGLQRLIDAAVRHQLGRPALARLLDQEEGRLTIGEDLQPVGERIAAVLRRCLESAGLADVAGEHTAADVLAIVKGMVDAAGQRGETDPAALRARVERAVFGYLEGR
jgi:AcrR family transcriptional regulator